MKKLLLTSALIGAALAPIAAQAQDYGHNREYRGDRHEGRDRHEDRDQRYDRDHRDGRDQRFDHDRRDGRHESWRDRGRDGGYRNRGGWNAPFAYRSFGIGAVVPGAYYGSRYYENDWRSHRLPAPRYGYYRYVRHYGDLLLINTRNGRVERVYRGYYR